MLLSRKRGCPRFRWQLHGADQAVGPGTAPSLAAAVLVDNLVEGGHVGNVPGRVGIVRWRSLLDIQSAAGTKTSRANPPDFVGAPWVDRSETVIQDQTGTALIRDRTSHSDTDPCEKE